MTNLYDVTIKRFGDGTIQYRANLIFVPYNNFVLSPSFEKEKKSDPVRSAKNSYNRSVANLYDIVHSNEWEYFFTLTLDPKKVEDRYNYEIVTKYISRFTDLLYKQGCLYIIVPEKHKDGAWHFHGLLTNCNDLKLVVNDNGYFEFRSYHYGYCSLDRVKDTARASNYILKYMVKGYNYLDIPKGKKRYWASRGLNRPDIEYDVMTEDQISDLLSDSFYFKVIDSDFYNGYIIDCREY